MVMHYTRFVALSKHSLWILVTLVIGIVVWVASDNSGDNGTRLVFSNVPKTGNLENVMLKPHYQGINAHDQPFTVLADTATQLDSSNVALVKVRADMLNGNGAWMALNSGKGHLNTQTKMLELTDGVDVFYEGGYEFRSDHAHVDIQQGTAYGDSKVEGQGPSGTLTADSFSIRERGKTISFNGSVRVKLYR